MVFVITLGTEGLQGLSGKTEFHSWFGLVWAVLSEFHAPGTQAWMSNTWTSSSLLTALLFSGVEPLQQWGGLIRKRGLSSVWWEQPVFIELRFLGFFLCNIVGNLQSIPLQKSATNSFLMQGSKYVVLTTFFTSSVWNFIFLLLGQWMYFWKGLSSVTLFLALIPYYLDDLKKGRLKIGFMDHISVSPWSRLTETLWIWPAPLQGCRYGQTTGHTWPCKELEHRAYLAVGFEDVNFWNILD